MKKLVVLILAAAMLLALAACAAKNEKDEVNVEDLPLVGAWETPEDTALTEEAKAAFDKAMEGLVGVDYEPLALVGTQVVSGMNYCILCKATPVYPDAESYEALVTVYADLNGNAEVTDIQELS